ncbi:MAG: hypothetical protein ACRCX2_39565 [Paraclostridium sp.]
MWRCKKCNGEVVEETIVPTSITKKIKENGEGKIKYNEHKLNIELSKKYYCIMCKKETKKNLIEIAKWTEER